METKTCKECGAVFQTSVTAKAYCREQCSRRAQKRRAADRVNPMVQFACSECGRVVTRRGKGQGAHRPATCVSQSCQSARRRKRMVIINRRHRQDNPNYKCPKCGGSKQFKAEYCGKCNPNKFVSGGKRLSTGNALLMLPSVMREIKERILKRDGMAICYTCRKVMPIADMGKKGPTMTRGRCKPCGAKQAMDNERKRWIKDPDGMSAKRQGLYERRMADPTWKMIKNLRARTYGAIRKANNGTHGGKKHTLEYLGCSAWQARRHVTRQLKRGMTWSNYGDAWHIDHVIPIAQFDMTREDDRYRAFHYSNLQPLWAFDNRSKGKNITHEHQPILMAH